MEGFSSKFSPKTRCGGSYYYSLSSGSHKASTVHVNRAWCPSHSWPFCPRATVFSSSCCQQYRLSFMNCFDWQLELRSNVLQAFVFPLYSSVQSPCHGPRGKYRPRSPESAARPQRTRGWRALFSFRLLEYSPIVVIFIKFDSKFVRLKSRTKVNQNSALSGRICYPQLYTNNTDHNVLAVDNNIFPFLTEHFRETLVNR